jgi:hypothetical protein
VPDSPPWCLVSRPRRGGEPATPAVRCRCGWHLPAKLDALDCAICSVLALRATQHRCACQSPVLGRSYLRVVYCAACARPVALERKKEAPLGLES